MAIIIGLLFGLLPTALVLVIGGLPTLVAVVVDGHRRHHLARCVGFLNFAGVAPYLAKIWMNHTVLAAMRMLTDPFVWLVMRYYVIAREERYLRGAFGAQYEAYCARVRRWL